MIPKECKRLAEVDFPIAVVSKHSAREKSIRHGHPSTLHLWWARRPPALDCGRAGTSEEPIVADADRTPRACRWSRELEDRMNPERACNRLALLVGSNPLPNYIAATVLRPETVLLLYSAETRDPYDRLKRALAKHNLQLEGICIADATNVRQIRDACRQLDVEHLHYSGGTKSMAAHARIAIDIKDRQASYIDERKGLLRFDNGYDIDLEKHDFGLTLDVLMRLHGIAPSPDAEPVEGGPTLEDRSALCARVLGEPEVAQQVYDALRPDGKRRGIEKAKRSPWDPCKQRLTLTAETVPGPDWTGARYEVWDRFLTGGWLEEWTGEQVRSCLGEDHPEIRVGVECKRTANGRKVGFEIDVALVRGHRLFVVSCTTDTRKALCKGKLFEVAMRSRQMGGDLARCALVCLLGKGPQGEDYVEELRSDIDSLWDAPNVPGIFGLADVREWAGTSGNPNLDTLKEWLNS